MEIINNIVLSVSHLSVVYQHSVALENINFSIERGSCVGIVGPNGAGKSTLLKALMGIIAHSTGTVTFFNSTLNKERARIAYVSQRSAVDWDFPITVFDVVLMGCYGALGWFKRPGDKEKRQVWHVLEQVGMVAYAQNPIGSLSGGQQQRVFLARALVQNADLYVMDEPFAGVDMATENIMITLFKQLCKMGKTVIIVHHDLQTLERYFDILIVINKTIISLGPVRNILQSNALFQAYGRPMDHHFGQELQ